MGRTIFNLMLFSLVVFMGVRTAESWKRNDGPGIDPSRPVENREPRGLPIPVGSPPPVRSESDYRAVVEKNLFSPDRKPAEEPDEETRPVVQPRQSPDPVRLAGVIISGGYKAALLDRSKDPAAKQEEWIEEGGRIGGFTVLEIRRDRVLLEHVSEPVTVTLWERRNRRANPKGGKEASPSVISLSKAPIPDKKTEDTPGRRKAGADNGAKPPQKETGKPAHPSGPESAPEQ